MKTTKAIITMAVILLFFITGSIAAPENKVIPLKSGNQIHQYLQNVIDYPEFAKSTGLEGFVLVQYQINQSGKIKIDLINGSNKQLMNYVRHKMGELNLPESDGNVHCAKIEFKIL